MGHKMGDRRGFFGPQFLRNQIYNQLQANVAAVVRAAPGVVADYAVGQVVDSVVKYGSTGNPGADSTPVRDAPKRPRITPKKKALRRFQNGLPSTIFPPPKRRFKKAYRRRHKARY